MIICRLLFTFFWYDYSISVFAAITTHHCFNLAILLSSRQFLGFKDLPLAHRSNFSRAFFLVSVLTVSFSSRLVVSFGPWKKLVDINLFTIHYDDVILYLFPYESYKPLNVNVKVHLSIITIQLHNHSLLNVLENTIHGHLHNFVYYSATNRSLFIYF